jgi:hypothetical protein
MRFAFLLTNLIFILTMPIWGGTFFVVLICMDAWRGWQPARDVFSGKRGLFG